MSCRGCKYGNIECALTFFVDGKCQSFQQKDIEPLRSYLFNNGLKATYDPRLDEFLVFNGAWSFYWSKEVREYIYIDHPQGKTVIEGLHKVRAI